MSEKSQIMDTSAGTTSQNKVVSSSSNSDGSSPTKRMRRTDVLEDQVEDTNLTSRNDNDVDSSVKDKVFMERALSEKKKSKDPECKVGACIVNKGKIVGFGYNDMPKQSDEFSWDKNKEDKLNCKLTYVVHAEMNAVVKAHSDKANIAGGTLYVTRIPCNECAKLIIEMGITEVVYADTKETIHKKESWKEKASRIMFKKTGVDCRELKTT